MSVHSRQMTQSAYGTKAWATAFNLFIFLHTPTILFVTILRGVAFTRLVSHQDQRAEIRCIERRRLYSKPAISAALFEIMIGAGWLFAVTPDESIWPPMLQDHFMPTSVFLRIGNVHDIVPTASVKGLYTNDTLLNWRSCVVMHGPTDMHTYVSMKLTQGYPRNLSLLKWLHQCFWPLETECVSRPSFCQYATLLACAEMLHEGGAFFADMKFYPDADDTSLLPVGMPAVLGLLIISFLMANARTADEYLELGHEACRKLWDDRLISFLYGLLEPFTVNTVHCHCICDASTEKGLSIHKHLHEIINKCPGSALLDRSNPACHRSDVACHPLKDFDARSFLTSAIIAGHVVHFTDEEIAPCSKRLIKIFNCPSSSTNLPGPFVTYTNWVHHLITYSRII